MLWTADGKEKSIPKADIDEREKGSSLMPRGLVKFMTRQEFLDLTRFLAELGKPGTAYAVRSTPTVQRWRRLTDVPPALLADVPGEGAFNAAVPGPDAPTWQPAYALVDGKLPLAEQTGGSDAPLYLLAQVDVTAGGAVGLTFDSVAGLDLWLDGDRLDTLSPAFVSELAVGRHRVVLRVDPGTRPEKTLAMRLFFPEGSAARAEPVGGP